MAGQVHKHINKQMQNHIDAHTYVPKHIQLDQAGWHAGAVYLKRYAMNAKCVTISTIWRSCPCHPILIMCLVLSLRGKDIQIKLISKLR